MEIDKDKIKEKIIEFERRTSGLYRISGVDIKVVNFRVRKDKYIADIIIREGEKSERYNNCEYPKGKI